MNCMFVDTSIKCLQVATKVAVQQMTLSDRFYSFWYNAYALFRDFKRKKNHRKYVSQRERKCHARTLHTDRKVAAQIPARMP